jgi:hypothetical protein
MSSNRLNISCAVLHYTAKGCGSVVTCSTGKLLLSATFTSSKLRSANISVEPYVPLHYTAKGCGSISYLLLFRIADKPFWKVSLRYVFIVS